ncbi:hypothetical protein [Methyloversatilis universalis]|uniref:hypothetical protein n=1 Tax=Methyloversatilis universalis TaxID=378211 RepID=UPI00037AFB9A|nr:hypothetical protein [Methyloversatilis universalis]
MPADHLRLRLFALLLPLALTACAGGRPAPSPEAPAASPTAAQPEALMSDAERQLLQALQAAQPRGGNPARARTLLDALLAAQDDASKAVHPHARALLDLLNERQRLDAANQKLTQQLERSSQQAKDSQARADELQRKLDALADIERSLPGARVPSRGVPR